jgi:hypothetical protein
MSPNVRQGMKEAIEANIQKRAASAAAPPADPSVAAMQQAAARTFEWEE